MLAGTGSDVGKSLIATGLCRIFLRDGYSPAPFKAQNMALNSYATPDGFEIGRAQAVQAEAAGIPCSTDMNPLLLKPSGERTSQVVLNGKAIGNRDAYDYFRHEGREELRTQVCAAFDRLASRFNPVVMEGAGSIAEINLRDSDIVNMSMARHADAAVILVADIDRGGVFASAYGSVMLQNEEDRRRIRGIIINKFRGDIRLFEQGRKMLEELCGIPVLGVVPFAPDIHIDAEDSVVLATKRRKPAEGRVNIAVILLDRISNFTDFDTLERDSRINLFYTSDPADIGASDVVIIPGSKSTLSDLYQLRRSGMASAIIEAASAGKTVIGICGGYQIMGREVSDPDGVEGSIRKLPGLGLLPVSTIISGKKVTRRVTFDFLGKARGCHGYEIHVGRTTLDPEATPLNTLTDGSPDGCMVSGHCFGSYIHGLLDNPAVIDHIVGRLSAQNDTCGNADIAAFREEQYDCLADHLRRHIDIPHLYRIMSINND